MTTLRAARRRRGIGNAHSECQANPLMRNPSKFSEFSELALKDKRNYLDFDSAIPGSGPGAVASRTDRHRYLHFARRPATMDPS